MKSIEELTLEEGADVVIAEGFGLLARKDGSAKAPAECRRLAALLELHNGPIGTTIIPLLLSAWNRGFQATAQPVTAIGHMVLSEKVIKEIASLTDRNHHGEAYKLGAETLGLSKLAERFDGIEYRRQKLGHLSLELQQERGAAYEELMDYARSHMSTTDYQLFHMAF